MSPLPDPHDGTLPARYPAGGPRPHVDVNLDDDYTSESAPPLRKVSAALAWRAFRRHIGLALVLWAAGSAALMTLAYYRVKPSYDAIARVRVEAGEQSLFTIKNGTPVEFAEFKETQVASVTSPVVLSLALTAHPELFQFPRLQEAEDAEAEIRQLLKVAIIPKTNLIEIAMSSDSPAEAAGIVNAVLDAYLKNASNTSNEETERRIEQLKKAVDERSKELDLSRAEWRRLSETIGAADVEGVKDSKSITTDDYREWNERLSKVVMERVTTEAQLEQLRSEKAASTVAQDRGEIELAVRDALAADPRIAQLQDQLDRAEVQRADAHRRSRDRSDPGRVYHERRIRDLKAMIAARMAKLRPGVERQVVAGTAQVEDNQILARTQAQLAGLISQEAHLREKLNEMKIKSRAAGSEALQLEFARHDTARTSDLLHKVEDMLNQLEHEARSPIARVRKEFPAKLPNRPNSNNRIKVMALAPIVMMFLVLGMLVTLERGAGRVGDPEELSFRSRLQVLGVVPPLPPLRPPGMLARRDESRAQRRLDEFVQSLDHLRVALCARPDPWGRDRHCVLITSACGSEGKTTLAAQLAERCVNAGLMTLLIDADLRNPTLSRMLDAADADGLINILRGESEPEAAMLVIGDAGGFHFLPAGTPRIDPSRLLQGDALGTLLAQARESFDMIIVDAPPVLPVPDALTIGRWTDGAVLAVRYDTSRFATVERAQRRLAQVGVPVLGAVVNGVRSSSTSYGGYYAYGYGGNAAAESPAVDG